MLSILRAILVSRNLGTIQATKSCPQCNRNCLVPLLRQQLQRRAAIFPVDPECCQQKTTGNREVLPGVERPLAVPGELDGIGEGLEVGDGPLVAVGAAGTDEVAQQVKMEADEDQERRQPWMGRQGASLDHRAEGETYHRAGDDVGG